MSALTSRLGLGCAIQGNLFRARSDAESEAVFDAAWEAGIRHFDTAPHYGLGLSEKRLGRFLASKPRDEYVLSTKVGRLLRPDPWWDGAGLDTQGFAVPARLIREWDFTRGGVRTGLEESLTRLGIDRVDILYAHDPEASGIDGAVESALRSLAELRDEGLVGRIGVGSMAPDALLAAVHTGLSDVVMVAGRYTLLDQSVSPAVLDSCERHGTRIVAAAVFNSGLLAEAPHAGAMFDYGAVPPDVLTRAVRIAEVCATHRVDVATAALQFPLRDPRVDAVVVGAKAPAHIKQNRARLEENVPDRLWTDLADEGLVPRCG